MITGQSKAQDVAIPTDGGIVLRGRYWSRPQPRGVVAVVHGFGEHGGCYGHVAEAIGTALDLDFVAPDLRGHGRSPGRRGVVGNYAEFVSDVRSSIDWMSRKRPGLPRFLLGHSNGGLLALRVAVEGGHDLNGLIVSNPPLKLAAHVPAYKIAAGRFLLRFAPGVTLSGKLPAEMMTRDPVMQEEHRTDTLRHSRISAPLFFGMADSAALVKEGAPSMETPILMILGADDGVTNPEESRLVFERLGSPDKTLRIYPGMRHEPLNELGREEVFNDTIAWLDERLAPLTAPA